MRHKLNSHHATCIFIIGKNTGFFARLHEGNLWFVSQQMKPCVFQCAASAAHFFHAERKIAHAKID